MNDNDNNNAVIAATYYTMDAEERYNLEIELSLCLQIIALKYNLIDKRNIFLYACEQCLPVATQEQPCDNPYFLLLSKVIDDELAFSRHLSKMEFISNMIEIAATHLEEDVQEIEGEEE